MEPLGAYLTECFHPSLSLSLSTIGQWWAPIFGPLFPYGAGPPGPVVENQGWALFLPSYSYFPEGSIGGMRIWCTVRVHRAFNGAVDPVLLFLRVHPSGYRKRRVHHLAPK